MLSRRCHVNPDNVATPIASSLGDIITLALLSGSTRLLWNALSEWAQIKKNQGGDIMHFTGDIFKCIMLKENWYMFIDPNFNKVCSQGTS